MKLKSITEKINESLRVDSESDDDNGNSAKIENFDEYLTNNEPIQTTDFRKQNVKLLSEQSIKYKGKITSRKELNIGRNKHESSQSSSENEPSDSESELDYSSYQLSQQDDKFENSSEDEEDEKDDNDESDERNSMELEEDSSNTENDNESNRQEAEIRKGVCVRNQTQIWERLLEMRIRIQSLLNKSNHLPLPNHSSYALSIAKETTEKTYNLLKNLNELKMKLTSQFGELRTHMKRSIEDNSGLSDYSSGSPPLKRIAVQLENQHNQMRSYRNVVLLKWDDRTKLSTPGAGIKNKREEFDIVRKIETALLNQDVLIAKSREIKNNGEKNDEEGNSTEAQFERHKKARPDVYDDSDFYYQQLRELIEYKSSGSSNIAEITKQIVELQKIRQKMKKKVDTRASKGRKIRYVVHKKLVNFMAPDDATTWPEESKDELYKSLFAT